MCNMGNHWWKRLKFCCKSWCKKHHKQTTITTIQKFNHGCNDWYGNHYTDIWKFTIQVEKVLSKTRWSTPCGPYWVLCTLSMDGLAPMESGHPQVQWISNSRAWNRSYNAYQCICGYWNLETTIFSLVISAVFEGNRDLWGQDIRRLSENQISTHEIRTTMFIKVFHSSR